MTEKYIALIRSTLDRVGDWRKEYYDIDYTPNVVVKITVTGGGLYYGHLQDDFEYEDFWGTTGYRDMGVAVQNLYENIDKSLAETGY